MGSPTTRTKSRADPSHLPGNTPIFTPQQFFNEFKEVLIDFLKISDRRSIIKKHTKRGSDGDWGCTEGDAVSSAYPPPAGFPPVLEGKKHGKLYIDLTPLFHAFYATIGFKHATSIHSRTDRAAAEE